MAAAKSSKICLELRQHRHDTLWLQYTIYSTRNTDELKAPGNKLHPTSYQKHERKQMALTTVPTHKDQKARMLYATREPATQNNGVLHLVRQRQANK